MRILITFLALIICNSAFAECSKEENELKIPIHVIGSISKRLYAGDNHQQMNRVVISAPIEIKNFNIQRMDLTKGDVAEFWFPISYEVKKNKAETVLQGYPSSLKDLEIAITYSNGTCTRFIQKLL